MALQIIPADFAGRLDQNSLIVPRLRPAGMPYDVCHCQINVMLLCDLPGTLQKGRLILLQDAPILLTPENDLGAGAGLTLRALKQIPVDRVGPSADLRDVFRGELISQQMLP